MNKILSLDQIKEAYPNEWVLIEHPETDEVMNITRGLVIAHATERSQLSRNVSAEKPKDWAVVFTGSIPKEVVVIL